MVQAKALFLQTPFNGEWRVDNKPIPKPGSDELLIKIHSAALNPLEWKVRAFKMFVENYPAVLGCDAAGTVEEIGQDVTGFAKGDRVIAQGFLTNDEGMYQQYALAKAVFTAKVPDNISFDDAASVPTTFITASIALYSERPTGPKFKPVWEDGAKDLYKGHPIVILGGSGSVGQYAIQLARLSGFSPIITTASARNKDLLFSLGATDLIDRSSPDVASEITKALNGAEAKFIYDTVSEKSTQELAYELLAPGGTLALVMPPQVDQEKYKDKTVSFSHGYVRFPQNHDLGAGLFGSLTKLLEDGSIKPNRVEVLPGGLAAIPDGLERLRKGEVSGWKLVVRPQETA